VLVVVEKVELFEPIKFCEVDGCVESEKWNLTIKKRDEVFTKE